MANITFLLPTTVVHSVCKIGVRPINVTKKRPFLFSESLQCENEPYIVARYI
jgi:hypothetical protein